MHVVQVPQVQVIEKIVEFPSELEHVAALIKQVSFAPDDTYTATACPQVNRDFRGVVNPQFSTTSVEVSHQRLLAHFSILGR